MNKQKLIELRCKAWGITEDEYYCNQCSDFSLEDMARAYRRGKNKGARDKAIQNVGFYQKQMQDIYDKKNKQIAELEKENAELRTRCNELFLQTMQLTKAKEIIKKFSEFVNNEVEYDPEHPQEHTDLWNKLCEEAEQFLKDIEVEK